MRRYIDADALKWRYIPLTIQPEEFVTKSDVENAPTADVRENVHAHWVYKALEGFSEITFPVCSNCDEDAIDYVESNFCPNCGAVMDEVVEEPTMKEYMYGQEGSEEDGSL